MPARLSDSARSVADAFAADHAPLPALDREIMLCVSYKLSRRSGEQTNLRP